MQGNAGGEERMMASGPKDETTGVPPAPDDAKAEREAVAVIGTGEDAASAAGAPPPSPSGDSPKPHGDKMEHAVREAANTPPKGNG